MCVAGCAAVPGRAGVNLSVAGEHGGRGQRTPMPAERNVFYRIQFC